MKHIKKKIQMKQNMFRPNFPKVWDKSAKNLKVFILVVDTLQCQYDPEYVFAPSLAS